MLLTMKKHSHQAFTNSDTLENTRQPALHTDGKTTTYLVLGLAVSPCLGDECLQGKTLPPSMSASSWLPWCLAQS